MTGPFALRMTSVRIIIADHQAKVRFALRVALERHPGFKTVGEAGDAGDLTVQAQAICPDLAIIAWELPGMPIPELIRTLRQNCPTARVIVLGSRAETRAPALAASADAFVCMGDSPDALSSAIETCLAQPAQVQEDEPCPKKQPAT